MGSNQGVERGSEDTRNQNGNGDTSNNDEVHDRDGGSHPWLNGTSSSKVPSSNTNEGMNQSGNIGCFRFLKSSGSRKAKLNITIAAFGLDNAGKTSTILALAKEPLEDVAPTVGFNPKSVMINNTNVTLFDLGGGLKIRKIWDNYLPELHGAIFVVDAADPERIQEAADCFKRIAESKYISGKPLLVLANKSDKNEALSEYDLTEAMGLEQIVNDNKIPTKVHRSSTKEKSLNHLKNGVTWLITMIHSDYGRLSQRISNDMKEEKERQKTERLKRLERMEKQKQQDEMLAVQVKHSNGAPKDPGSEPDEHSINEPDVSSRPPSRPSSRPSSAHTKPKLTAVPDITERKEQKDAEQVVPSSPNLRNKTGRAELERQGGFVKSRSVPRTSSPVPDLYLYGESANRPLKLSPLSPLRLEPIPQLPEKRKKKKKRNRIKPLPVETAETRSLDGELGAVTEEPG